MKILIVSTDYPAFLDWLYQQNPSLATACYEDQMCARYASLFGVADFYSRNLRQLGHEACDVYPNNDLMQMAWARERDRGLKTNYLLTRAKRALATTSLKRLKPVVRPLVAARTRYAVLTAQVRHYRPDILLNQSVDGIPDDLLWEIKPYTRAIVGQIAAPLRDDQTFRSYDLLISSLPNFVDRFRKQGMRSELNRLAFEASLASRFGSSSPAAQVSFVGSVSSDHSSRLKLLEALCDKAGLAWWGTGVQSLPPGSALRSCYRGPAWGGDMYRALQESRITINHHIDAAGEFANNTRLFEATGMGTLLLTDRKSNLRDMFEPGKEVAAYGSVEECVEWIRHYLDHESERKAVAFAGQQRTLREHTYEVRMLEMAEILTTCLAG